MNAQDQPQVAVVTGAGGGLGAVIANEFVAAGYRVAFTDIREGAAVAAAAAADPDGGSTVGLGHDIREESSFEEVLRRTRETLGEPAVLVNNAGRTLFGKPLEIDADEFDAGVQLNLGGVFRGCKVFGRSFAEQGYGRIVNIASLAGQNGGTASGVHYASAKGGVLSLTKVFARELGPRGVTVNAIAPGPLDLPVVHESVPAERLREIVAGIPVRSLLSPRFVGQTAVLLASPEALSVTGACWDINGGLNVR